ncbi:transposase [Cyanobium sp. CH-040]|nr:transposase [Cyanobium sp. CH-040]
MAVLVLQERCRASERFTCRVVGQHRSTRRHPGKVVDLEKAELRDRLRQIVVEHIRWGRRITYRLLLPQGWKVNSKRVQWLWRDEGLQRLTPRKCRRARPADGSVRRHRAVHPHQGWAGGARSGLWSRCWTSSPASTRHQRSSDRTADRSSLPMLCGTGMRPAPPSDRLPSSQEPGGRTASPIRSTDGLGISYSTPSYSPLLPRLNSSLIAGAASPTRSGHIRPLKGVPPSRQLNKMLQRDHDHPLSSALDRLGGFRAVNPSGDGECPLQDAFCRARTGEGSA